MLLICILYIQTLAMAANNNRRYKFCSLAVRLQPLIQSHRLSNSFQASPIAIICLWLGEYVCFPVDFLYVSVSSQQYPFCPLCPASFFVVFASLPHHSLSMSMPCLWRKEYTKSHSRSHSFNVIFAAFHLFNNKQIFQLNHYAVASIMQLISLKHYRYLLLYMQHVICINRNRKYVLQLHIAYCQLLILSHRPPRGTPCLRFTVCFLLYAVSSVPLCAHLQLLPAHAHAQSHTHFLQATCFVC